MLVDSGSVFRGTKLKLASRHDIHIRTPRSRCAQRPGDCGTLESHTSQVALQTQYTADLAVPGICNHELV